MTYKIVLYPSEEGWAVSCPALPGCWSQGETREAAIINIQGAIGDYLAVLEENLRADMETESAEISEVEVAA